MIRFTVVTLTTPLGPLRVISDGDVLVAAPFAGLSSAPDGFPVASHEALLRRRHPDAEWVNATATGPSVAMARYFDGELAAVDDVAVAPTGSPFQQEVWKVLRRIPPGDMISYGELAARVGRPTASRAVGAANGRNPIPIVIPCHRVIGADGTLTGYAGGMQRKKWLLDHERRQADLFPPPMGVGTERTVRP